MAEQRPAEARDWRTVRNASLRLALWYAAASTVWVLTSDQLVGSLGLPPDLTVLANSAKGFLFVLVTAALLYVFSRRYLGRIEASEERYYSLFENATEGVTLYRVLRDEAGGFADLVIEDVNPAQTERSGMSREDIVGKRMSAPGELDQEMCAYFPVVREAVIGGVPKRAEVHAERRDTYTLVAVFPFERDLWALGETDITQVRHAQEALRQQDERIRQAYEDVLDAVTGGKLVLMTEAELDRSLGVPLTDPLTIADPVQLADARRAISGAVEARFPGTDVTSILSSAGEALNNLLTHAGRGTYQVLVRGDDTLQVAIADQGPGIDFRTLPRATLVPGFSTTATLGMGFTIMLQLAHRVLLTTRRGHTVIVLETSAMRDRGEHSFLAGPDAVTL